MRRLLFALSLIVTLTAAANDFLKSLPGASALVEGYADVDSVEARLAAMPLLPAEGLWQMTDGGAIIAVERYVEPTLPFQSQVSTFRLVMVKSPVRRVRPGTVIGYAVTTAKNGVLEARLYSDFARESRLSVPRTFYLQLSTDGSTLTFKAKKSRLAVNPFKLLPYLYRHAVTIRQNTPDDLNGAVRLFPPMVSPRFGPRYL